MFDIVQFFPFLNHQLLSMILNKVDFDTRISQLSSSYLINRQTQYIWNYFTLLSFKENIGVGQGSALSSIPPALYIASLFYILEKRTKNLLIPILVSILSFVDDSLLVFQKKSYEKYNMNLYCSSTNLV